MLFEPALPLAAGAPAPGLWAVVGAELFAQPAMSAIAPAIAKSVTVRCFKSSSKEPLGRPAGRYGPHERSHMLRRSYPHGLLVFVWICG